MKKLIAILTLFVFSLFMVYPQSKSRVVYVDTLKSVTVNVSTDVNKKTVDPVQTLFAESLNNQIVTQADTKEYLDTLTSVLTSYVNDVEAKNKSDSEPVTTKFGYNTQHVKQILKTERWLDLLVLFMSVIYLIYINNQLSRRDSPENILIKGILYIAIGLVSALLLRWVLILVFNSGYFYIKELIALYT